MSPHLWRRGHIVFGAGPISIGICVTLSCLHNILWTSGWILTKFSWIYNWDLTKNWLDFGDLDLIFKITAVEKLKIHGMGTSFYENTVTSFSLKIGFEISCKLFPRDICMKWQSSKWALTLHANCLWWEKICMKWQSLFSAKLRKLFQNVVSWIYYPAC